jgi:hypothetical protein
MKNLFLLPTDKPSRLIIYSTLLNEFRLLDEPIDNWKHKRNINITNSEEIKEGDWVLYTKGIKIHYIKITNSGDKELANIKDSGVFKIILTTDTDLIKDGVQAIDDEFLEWFVKNPTCEFIKITKTSKLMNDFLYGLSFYKIIIPKEEQDNKMYSEEEVLEILKKFNQNAMEYIKQDDRNIMTSVTLEKWFEQFKKK